jgi:hypothetical protein
MVWGSVGGTEGLGYLGRQAGFGCVPEMRETGEGPEPGHRLARDHSGKPGKPPMGKSDERGFGFLAVFSVNPCASE